MPLLRIDPVEPATALMAWFARSAYIRMFDAERSSLERSAYKKGSEVRFTLYSLAEVREVRRLLDAVGLLPGKPFKKHSRILLPVYGAAAVEWFLSRLPDSEARLSMGFSPSGERIEPRSRTERASP